MRKTLEAHFVCRDRRDVFGADDQFITGSWAVPLAKARRIGRVCLHQTQTEPAYLSGAVTQIWIDPDSGRVAFRIRKDDGTATEIDRWSFVQAFRALASGPMTADREQLVRVVVRLGFAVAGADGLDADEETALTEFALARSGLSLEAVQEERRAAAAGVDSLTDADISMLAALDADERSDLFGEIREAAGADGEFAEQEAAALGLAARRVAVCAAGEA